MMDITFSCVGLKFRADVDFQPSRPAYMAGHPDTWEAPDDGDLEFLELECGGKDAEFLLDSDLAERLYLAASEAAEETYRDRRLAYELR